ncbi:MAG TPA: phenylalanine--tRNA ligase subunit beta [Clostridiales bacterium]|nr:phenylalanine--tRNA ligase subunit beta [Clostridiales bacterium]
MNWLKDYVDVNCTAREYSEQMTHTGTKVEGYTFLGDVLQNIFVGRVLEIEKHKDSDHLNICKVDMGDRVLQIVTGAQNVVPGSLVPVAIDGAVVAGGIANGKTVGKKIKSGKLRGEVSEGMLCSLEELGLTINDFSYAEEDGIFLLQEDCKLGDNIKDVCMLDDTVIEFELTFNRPDCLSVIGIARETAATLGESLRLHTPAVPDQVTGKIIAPEILSVEVQDEDLCPRYSAAMVKNVKIAPSPLWLRARLRAMGVRSINNIVDITNYVMLEYGQPMHAFDYSYIGSKRIVVRRARQGESITTLDSVPHELTADMLVIADGEKPIALAGIMGGENSEILDTTATVVFESANFNRSNVRHTANALGVRTESSGRFEKGLPAVNTMPALLRAVELVEMLGAGEACEGLIDINNADIGKRKIAFDYKRVNALLGTELTAEEMATLMLPLEMTVEKDGDKLLLVVPPFRGDIEKTADIAEEVARLYGYDKIKTSKFYGEAIPGGLTDRQKFDTKINNTMVSLGYTEAYTYSFISPKYYDLLRLTADDKRRNSIKLINPLGEDTSIMRTTAVASLLKTVAYNYSHRAEDVKLFEHSLVYIPNEDGSHSENKVLVAVGYGDCDFFEMKGVCEELLAQFNINNVEVMAENESYLQPGRSAGIYSVTRSNTTKLGMIGQVHPECAKEIGLPLNTYMIELDCESIYTNMPERKQYTSLPVYPSISRDIAIVCDVDTPAGDIAKVIKESGGKQLISVEIFDVYQGKGVPEGKKSVAYSMVLLSIEKTMSDEDADAVVKKVLKRVKDKFGAKLRS